MTPKQKKIILVIIGIFIPASYPVWGYIGAFAVIGSIFGLIYSLIKWMISKPKPKQSTPKPF